MRVQSPLLNLDLNPLAEPRAARPLRMARSPWKRGAFCLAILALMLSEAGALLYILAIYMMMALIGIPFVILFALSAAGAVYFLTRAALQSVGVSMGRAHLILLAVLIAGSLSLHLINGAVTTMNARTATSGNFETFVKARLTSTPRSLDIDAKAGPGSTFDAAQALKSCALCKDGLGSGALDAVTIRDAGGSGSSAVRFAFRPRTEANAGDCPLPRTSETRIMRYRTSDIFALRAYRGQCLTASPATGRSDLTIRTGAYPETVFTRGQTELRATTHSVQVGSGPVEAYTATRMTTYWPFALPLVYPDTIESHGEVQVGFLTRSRKTGPTRRHELEDRLSDVLGIPSDHDSRQAWMQAELEAIVTDALSRGLTLDRVQLNASHSLSWILAYKARQNRATPRERKLLSRLHAEPRLQKAELKSP